MMAVFEENESADFAARFKAAKSIGLVAWGPLGQGFLTGKIIQDMKFDRPNDAGIDRDARR